MAGWKDRVEDLLYENETVEEVVDVDSARVVVTSHRVMTFTPEMNGENFEQAERPNVTVVETSAVGKTGIAARSVRYGIYGGFLLLGGLVINFESYVGGLEIDAEAADKTGAGGIMGVVQGMVNFMSSLDELLQILGALVLLVAIVLFSVYWLLRTPTLVIRIAGDRDDLHVPRPEDADLAATALEEAILLDDRAEDSSGKLSSVLPNDLF